MPTILFPEETMASGTSGARTRGRTRVPAPMTKFFLNARKRVLEPEGKTAYGTSDDACTDGRTTSSRISPSFQRRRRPTVRGLVLVPAVVLLCQDYDFLSRGNDGVRYECWCSYWRSYHPQKYVPCTSLIEEVSGIEIFYLSEEDGAS